MRLMEIVSIPSVQDPLCPSSSAAAAPRPARPSRFSSPLRVPLFRFAVLPRWRRTSPQPPPPRCLSPQSGNLHPILIPNLCARMNRLRKLKPSSTGEFKPQVLKPSLLLPLFPSLLLVLLFIQPVLLLRS